MKENKYDNQEFFEKYSRMERSVKGLEGAGEWEQFRKMMPDFAGKRVLIWGSATGGIAPMLPKWERPLCWALICQRRC